MYTYCIGKSIYIFPFCFQYTDSFTINEKEIICFKITF